MENNITISGVDDGVVRLFKDAALNAQLLNNAIAEFTKVAAGFNDKGEAIKAVMKGVNDQGHLVTSTVKVLADGIAKMTLSVEENQKALRKQEEALRAERLEQEKNIRQLREGENIRRSIQRGFTRKELMGRDVSHQELFNLKYAESNLAGIASASNLTTKQVQNDLNNVRNDFIKAYGNKAYLSALQQLVNAQRAVGTSAQAEMTKAQNATKNATKAVHEFTLSWESIGRLVAIQLLRRALFAVSAALRESIKDAMEFSKRVAEIQTISQNAQLTTDEWTKGLRNLSESFGLGIMDTAEAAYQALSNQIAEGADTFKFMETAAKFSIITTTSLTDSVSLLTAALNAYGKDASEADDVSAKLFKTIELGRIRGSELSNTLGRVTALAGQLGVPLEEVAAFLDIVTIRGVKTNEALTQLRGVFTKLIRPTDEMKELFKELGVTSAEGLIQGRNLLEFFVELQRRTQGSSTELGKYFPLIRGISGATVAASTATGEFADSLAQINNASASAAKALELTMESSGKLLERELTKIKNFFTLGFGATSTELVAKFAGTWLSFSGIVKTFSTIVAGFLLPTLVKLGHVLFTLGKATPFGGWLTAIGLAAGAIARIYSYIVETEEEAQAAIQKAIEARMKFVIDEEKKLGRVIEEQITARQKIENRASSDVLGALYSASKAQAEIIKTLNTTIKDEFEETTKTLKSGLQQLQKQQNDTVKTFEDLATFTVDIGKTINEQIFDFSLERLGNVSDKLLLYQREIQATEQRLAAASIVGDATSVQSAGRDLLKLTTERHRLALKTKEEQKKLAIDITKKEADLVADVLKFEEQKRLEGQTRNFKRMQQFDIKERNLIVKKMREIELLRSELAGLQNTDIDKYANNFEQQLRKVQNDLNTFIQDLQAEQLKNAIDNAQKEADYKRILKQQEVEQEKYTRFDPKKIDEAETVEALQQIFTERLRNIDALINSTKELENVQSSVANQQYLQNLESQKANILAEQGAVIGHKKLSLAVAEGKLNTEALITLNKELTDRRVALQTQRQELEKLTTALSVPSLIRTVGYTTTGMPLQRMAPELGGLTEKQSALLIKTLNAFSDFKGDPAAENAKLFSSYISELVNSNLPETFINADTAITRFLAKGLEISKIVEGYNSINADVNAIDAELFDIRAAQNLLLPATAAYEKAMKGVTDQIKKQESALIRVQRLLQNMRAATAIEQITRQEVALPFARGGHVASSDRVPALLSPGEFIVNAKSARQFYSQLVGINSGMVRGGQVSQTTIGDLHINYTPSGSEEANVINIGKRLRRAVRRGTVRLS